MLNIRLLSGMLTTALTLGNTVLLHQPSYAGGTTFECLPPTTQNPEPRTVAKTARGEFPIIIWRSRFFEREKDDEGRRFNAMLRCQDVSERFQVYYNCQLLDPKSIAGATLEATVNRKTVVYPVVLITNPTSGGCSTADGGSSVKGLLFMLPPHEDINRAAGQLRQILQQLDDIRFNGGEPIVN